MSLKPRDHTDHIVIHCSWTPANMDIGAYEIDQWHRRKGWLGIGYHFVIRRDGTVEPGRGLQYHGAHVAGQNATSVGVCLVGGKSADGGDEDNFYTAQKESLRVVLDMLRLMYPNAEVVGHNFFNKRKTCPVMDISEFQ